MTEEEGTISGDLDVAVDESGRALVRYRDTDTWYTIGNLEGSEPLRWSSATELAKAIESEIGQRDPAGNTIPFEA
ncbi:hypothetical protein NDR87_16790 [Nocardia sp. CDC159]|uniref:Uncharacterized protein n=1 Tax=Nocardia pulmonis TaxID=2951408 RepID=A0A9X2E961_9NOCA|nr:MULTISPECIES: hypothetical protein [Nocardia]MCM6775248.1 hypothetical protein [Nocardia pulmonis]MCM6788018.1 hypothetical protein [Nocardia sp. CDC159]